MGRSPATLRQPGAEIRGQTGRFDLSDGGAPAGRAIGEARHFMSWTTRIAEVREMAGPRAR